MGKKTEQYFIALTRTLLGKKYKIEYVDRFGKNQVVWIPRKFTKEFCCILSGQNYVPKCKPFMYDTFHIVLEKEKNYGRFQTPKRYRITGYSDGCPLKYSLKNVTYGTDEAQSLYRILQGLNWRC